MTDVTIDIDKLYAEQSELQSVTRNSGQRFLLAAKLLDKLEHNVGLNAERQRVEGIKGEAFMTFINAQSRLDEIVQELEKHQRVEVQNCVIR